MQGDTEEQWLGKYDQTSDTSPGLKFIRLRFATKGSENTPEGIYYRRLCGLLASNRASSVYVCVHIFLFVCTGRLSNHSTIDKIF